MKILFINCCEIVHHENIFVFQVQKFTVISQLKTGALWAIIFKIIMLITYNNWNYLCKIFAKISVSGGIRHVFSWHRLPLYPGKQEHWPGTRQNPPLRQPPSQPSRHSIVVTDSSGLSSMTHLPSWHIRKPFSIPEGINFPNSQDTTVFIGGLVGLKLGYNFIQN